MTQNAFLLICIARETQAMDKVFYQKNKILFGKTVLFFN